MDCESEDYDDDSGYDNEDYSDDEDDNPDCSCNESHWKKCVHVVKFVHNKNPCNQPPCA